MIPHAALTLALLAAPALAQGKQGGTGPDCYCTNTSGGRIELGEKICLTVNGRSFTAQCQMSLNVPMWRDVGQGCLSSAVPKTAAPSG